MEYRCRTCTESASFLAAPHCGCTCVAFMDRAVMVLLACSDPSPQTPPTPPDMDVDEPDSPPEEPEDPPEEPDSPPEEPEDPPEEPDSPPEEPEDPPEEPESPPEEPESPPAAPCQNLYQQCGGINWTGAVCCTKGSCKPQNTYYSQCLE